ncbi:hypothetical protein PHMEG_00019530 [Phytophthora megakarya]|uniref:Uncharacterized protein n=1 Tax=Phytophthora megakarya TaxID=4795 RepID=A0A225VRA7_9STRA|nr:hypothetical protein PHMEG_00019530 [Phytophthora megakarya]
MAPNGGKATPAHVAPKSSPRISAPAHTSGDTPDGGNTEGGGDRASSTQPSPQRRSSRDESESRSKDGAEDEGPLEVESSSGESDDDEVSNTGESSKGPHATKTPTVRQPTPKQTSRTLKMSELECMLAFGTSGETRLVGIPATREHLKTGAFIQDGYGGLEALIQMESLGLQELGSLADYVADGEDIYDFVLTPRDVPLLDGDLDEAVKSVEFQREVASILTEFTPDQLAQRVFGTVSVLRKVTAERTMLSRQLALADQTTQDVAKGPVEIERLNKELVFVRDSLKRHIQKQDEDHEFHAGRHRADLQKYLAEEQANVRGLQVQVSTLQARLQAEDARRGACRQSRLDVDPVMNFLNANSQFSLQWPRLRSLLEHCRDNTQVPSSWRTTISIMAADDPSVSTSAYIPVPRSDDDGDGESKNDSSSQGHPRGSFLDLTRDSETKPSGGGAKRKRSSKGTKKAREQMSPDVPAEIQEYPSAWIRESADLCRPDGELLLREMLKSFPVIWSSLHLDVRALILYGVNYEGALEWLGEDRSVHGCFHQGPLLEMLLRMMFWNELDDTPWTKYVPRRYFVVARAKLDSLLENDEHLNLWGPLVPVVEDFMGGETQTPERDDPTDQNWTNDPHDAGNDDDDYDDPLAESPSKSTRAQTKRRRIASAETKNPAKRQHQRKTCTALALKEHLTEDEMMIIEWCDKSINSPFGQTPGFPAYTPNRHDLIIFQRRFAEYFEEYREILRGAPWQDMWRNRPKVLYFHKRSKMTLAAQGALDLWVEYMCESMRHQWEMLHWVIFLLEFLPESAVLAESRRSKRHESLEKKGGRSGDFEWEASVWDIPHRVCHWILMGRNQLDLATKRPYSLREQLRRLDKAEPTRVQWTNCTTVKEQIAHLPEIIRKKILPEAEWEPLSEDI